MANVYGKSSMDVSPHVHGAKGLRGESSMGESPMDEMSSAGRNVYSMDVHGTKSLWANSLWGEMSSVGRNLHGANRPWGELFAERKAYKPPRQHLITQFLQG